MFVRIPNYEGSTNFFMISNSFLNSFLCVVAIRSLSDAQIFVRTANSKDLNRLHLKSSDTNNCKIFTQIQYICLGKHSVNSKDIFSLF